MPDPDVQAVKGGPSERAMPSERPMLTFTVYVTSGGVATITAATKKEADAKARRGEFDQVPRSPRWSAHISSLRKADHAE